MKNKAFLITLITILVIQTLLTGCAKSEGSGQNAAASWQTNTSESQTEEAVEETETDTDTVAEDTESTEITEEKEDETMNNTEIPALRDCVPEEMGGALIGCAVTYNELKDPKVFEILTTHFNAVTFGNELKPDCLFGYHNSACPGTEEAELNGETMIVPKLDFSRSEEMLDKIHEYNEANPDRQIKVRGHVLVWHSQTPEWFFHEDYIKTNDYVDKETMNKRLEWYIKTVLEHYTGPDSKYKDMFYGWDVVNEAISDNGGKLRTDAEKSEEKLSEDTHGSNSSWYHVYGSNEFIINAFKYANKYAPDDLMLFYNDYNETNLAKRNGIVELLKAIKENEGPKGEGTRISGMGMQGHYHMDDPSANEVEVSAKAYAEVVGTVQLTELDITASSDYDGSAKAKDEENEKLRKRYNVLYYTLRSLKNTQNVDITGITFWGTADHYSWLQSRSNVGGGNTSGLPQMPLLFDENYEPKPAFFVFAQTTG
ncbi:MAG: endo-1,4-beta-xylanase [Lachnospiraceae bacterium]|nr:endo-1,4-beta-xylanase [Lachnospiraceae bacterium]